MTGDVDMSPGHVNHPKSRPRAPAAETSALTAKPPDDFHEDAVRKLFDEIDDDNSGFLDKAGLDEGLLSFSFSNSHLYGESL